jgi:hypothetical protein
MTSSADHRQVPDRGDDGEREVFHFLRWAWDITAALDLSRDYPVTQVDISPIAGLAQLVAVNPKRVAAADLTRPLIIAPVPDAGHLVLDGWHRVHKGLSTGVTVLPARLLTAADEQRIRLRG